MTDDELSATWRDYKATGSVELRNALVVEYLPVVKRVAQRRARGLPPWIDLADLESVGTFGLINAIRDFDPERSIKFETFAWNDVSWAISNELKSFYSDQRPLPLSEFVRDRKTVSPEVRLFMKETLDSVAGHVKSFGAKHRLILFFLHYEELSLKETAERLGIAIGSVWRMHRRVLRKIRNLFQLDSTLEHSNRRRRSSRGKKAQNGLPCGVCVVGSGRFGARASFHGRPVHLGVYDTPAEAGLAYQRAVGGS